MICTVWIMFAEWDLYDLNDLYDLYDRQLLRTRLPGGVCRGFVDDLSVDDLSYV